MIWSTETLSLKQYLFAFPFNLVLTWLSVMYHRFVVWSCSQIILLPFQWTFTCRQWIKNVKGGRESERSFFFTLALDGIFTYAICTCNEKCSTFSSFLRRLCNSMSQTCWLTGTWCVYVFSVECCLRQRLSPDFCFGNAWLIRDCGKLCFWKFTGFVWKNKYKK